MSANPLSSFRKEIQLICHPTPSTRKRALICYLVIIFYQIRFYIFARQLNRHPNGSCDHADWLMFVLYQTGLRDPVLIFAITFVFLFVVRIHYRLYHCQTASILSIIDQIVLHSWPHAANQSIQATEWLPVLNYLYSNCLWQQFQEYRVVFSSKLWRAWMDKKRNKNLNLSESFSHLSNQNERLIVLIWMLLDIFIKIILISQFIFWCLIVVYFNPSIPNLNPFSFSILLILQLIDYLVYYLFLFFIVKMLIFFDGIVLVFASVFREKFTALNLFLKRKQSHIGRHKSRCRSILARVRHWHTDVSGKLSEVNGRFISPFLFEMLLTQTIFNVYCILFVFYGRVDPFMKLALITISSIQLWNGAAIFLSTLPVNEAILGLNRHFFSLVVNSSGLRERLKSSFYYELILHSDSHRSPSITVGPLGMLDRKMLSQFLLLYSAFIMHFLSKFIDNI